MPFHAHLLSWFQHVLKGVCICQRNIASQCRLLWQTTCSAIIFIHCPAACSSPLTEVRFCPVFVFLSTQWDVWRADESCDLTFESYAGIGLPCMCVSTLSRNLTTHGRLGRCWNKSCSHLILWSVFVVTYTGRGALQIFFVIYFTIFQSFRKCQSNWLQHEQKWW